MEPSKDQIAQWFKKLQDNICRGLEKADGAGEFEQDLWERPHGGGGRTRTIKNGRILEKGGVNFSAVHGPTPDNILNALQLQPADFFATGVSIVLHPHSPKVPIIHMNVRYFEMTSGAWWFGGGIDLTPHYIDKQDAQSFHSQLKQVCDQFHASYYLEFKQWADDYFYLKHREETRGVGGIFFDRLTDQQGFSKKQRWEFVQAVGSAFVPIYNKLMLKNHQLPYGEAEKEWQMIRRGRYVEFNLVWDKGTKFGLDTGGRTESILMSLPPQAHWEYDHRPAEDTEEYQTLRGLKKGINWVDGADY
ncbi:MAG: oxygen-dependent coproporphyrinogen oxidase [Cyclobacteriaceae bacterium]|nr:oxygen-dependent coproporphyrinogen oxidase [Cyclobacteriaceae bacterium]